MSLNDRTMTWLAADYHFVSLYSCRFAMSSMTSTQVVPTPGPATVRLAMIRTAVELFGVERTRTELFPIILSAPITIRPPDYIAISTQHLRGYKASVHTQGGYIVFDESLTYREYAHAADPMTIYIRILPKDYDVFHTILMAIGYWGQASSLVQCIGCSHSAPIMSECMTLVRTLNGQVCVGHLVAGFMTEFIDNNELTWQKVLGSVGLEPETILRSELYIWPMITIKHYGAGRVLHRYSM